MSWRRFGVLPLDPHPVLEMVEYPWVFDHDGTRSMPYNGNGYGRTGVGLAAWE